MNIELNKIQVDYIKSSSSEIWANDCIFESGKIYHIVAPSGKGKSSLIQLLYGINRAYAGDYLIQESSVKNISLEDWSARRTNQLSIVFQDLKLMPNITAFENIEIKRILSPHHPTEKIMEMANRLCIDHIIQKKTNTLSYGERQRVAIIRALMQPFECLLLDEAFSHLDENNIRLASELILEEVQSRKATLISADLEPHSPFPYNQILSL